MDLIPSAEHRARICGPSITLAQSLTRLENLSIDIFISCNFAFRMVNKHCNVSDIVSQKAKKS